MRKKKVRSKSKRSAKASAGVKKILDTGFLLTVGIASLAKENVDKVVRDLVRKGKLNENQGRKLVMDLIRKSKKERERIKKIMKS